ncbi:MAG: hypothetical protein IKW20_01755, partial [Bacteroidales bacterium]|nr:hypothetical protein [Bacteroidales bacterium]
VERLTPAPEAPVAPTAETPETPTPEVPETPAEPAGEQPTAPETPAEPAPAEPTEPEEPTEPAPTTPTQPTTPTEPAPTTPTEPIPAPTPAPAPKTGGAFGRMVQSFKSQIDKLIKKTEVKDFVGTDNTRPVMTGVYRANGYEYASDSMILVKVKAEYPAEQEGKIISVKTSKEIQGRYPDADGVIASSINNTSPLSENIDDIIAYAQTLEEIKKGMDKDAKLYVKVGNSLFESTRLLNAAKIAKKHGLTNILQRSEAGRAMVFEGSNGAVLVMPTNASMVSENIFNISTGFGEFGFNALHYLKTPATLKGIEAAKTTLEAVLPKLSLFIKDQVKTSGELQYIDGKVVWRFNKADIAKAKAKAKDANTYAALEEIENNGLVVPMSQSDAERIFPELFVSDTGVPTGEDAPTVPVAPNPVANPISEAKKKERQLALNLAKIGLSPEQKQDLAFNAGKSVADMFATREEYDAYAENAEDFGQYNADFDRGVEESFANRKSPVNSVPLSPEPKGDSNGENKPASTPPANTGRGSDTTGGRTNNGGSKGKSQGSQTTKSPRNSKSQTKVEDKYPARNGNATGKLLVDTFGFASVAIPDTQKKILNTIYDFMMEMSKTLGISPKTLGQGGWLNIRNKPTGKSNIASHEIISNTLTKDISDVSLRFKYSRLSSIAHEWWHSLDRALSYFETGKIAPTATEISESAFTGRKEAWEAVQAVMKALNDSGYTDRIRGLVKNQPRKVQVYYMTPTEQAASAFDQYISDRFAEAGIVIQNYDNYSDVTQPTAEEMKVVAPAIDNLFKVLKEKEGKKAGTSVLYQIGEALDNDSPAKQLATDAVLTALDDSGVPVKVVSDEEVAEMLRIRDEVSNPSLELMTVYHGSKSLFDEFDNAHMGEGEGAQAHGWGAYVAVDKKVGIAYANMYGVRYVGPKVEKGSVEESAVEAIAGFMNSELSFDEAVDKYIAICEKVGNDNAMAAMTFAMALNERDFASRNLYTVEIPDNNGSNYFDEGVMSKEQTERFVEACEKEGVDWIEVVSDAGSTTNIMNNPNQGSRIYRSLAKALGSKQKASELLAKAGFVGIKYNGRRDGECYVIFDEKNLKITDRTEFYQTPNGTVYGWADGKGIYLTKAGINPNTPIHEYTHLWAKAMMQKNPKGWQRIKDLLRNTPAWNDVLNDA